jgi:hypothetical protein
VRRPLAIGRMSAVIGIACMMRSCSGQQSQAAAESYRRGAIYLERDRNCAANRAEAAKPERNLTTKGTKRTKKKAKIGTDADNTNYTNAPNQ